MTYIDLMLAWDMMAGLGGLKISHLSTIRLFLEDGAETASVLCYRAKTLYEKSRLLN